MKFSDGFWRNREGFSVSSPFEIRDLEIDENSVTVYAPCIHVDNRGQTLQGPLFTIRYSSPMPDIICVQIYHYQGVAGRGPEFSLFRKPDHRVQITDGSDQVCLKSGALEARIRKNGEWSVNFYNGEQQITGTGRKNIAYIIAPDKSVHIREQLALGVGECVYGLGERFTPFVKNGQMVDIWNADGGTSSELAYKNIPFYLTNRGYGVFVNDPGCVSFEVASEKVSNVQFSVPGEYLEYYVIGGPTPKKVLENYTALTGRPALPPAWSFGLWLTTSFITNYDEQTVTSFIDGMAQRDLPLHVFHFDCFWMKEYQWCNFEWDHDVFPDPENMLKRLKARGLKICVWINSYIGQKSPLFAEGKEHGYLLKRPSGDVYQCDTWQPGMGLVDFTNPEACKWFSGKLRRLADMGVDCFKTDFGERIPTDVVYFDGSDPEKMHNYYTYLYNRVVFKTLEDKFGKGNAIVFARSATVGGQQFPVHWGGDCTANYESMAESLRGGLSLGLSGFGFWSHDISGFEHTATPDVYKRWTAFGLLSSHSRLHGNMSYRVPWLFDEEAVDVLRHFTKLKCSLMPYLFTVAFEASQKGLPVMRAMVLEFPDDPACAYLDREYLLGDSLLVAPIFSETGAVSYYLPEGRWTHFLTGEKIAGGCWRQEKHDYLSLPLLVRPGSIIPVGSRNDRPDYDYTDGVSFHVFELQENSSATTVVCNTEGRIDLEITLKRTLQNIQVEVRGGEKPWSIYLRGISSIKSVTGGAFQLESLGVRVTPRNGSRQLEMSL
ncbi:MAG TPA: alpha-xylosidase [Bacillota bacterium]|nr:alpha-xylosidase [Bacillota bacterium]